MCARKSDARELASGDVLGPLREAFYREPIKAKLQGKWAAWLQRYRERVSQEGDTDSERRARMNRVNPKYVLRNYLVQEAIERAEEGDYSEVHQLLELVRKPYDQQPQFEKYFAKRPEWARRKAGCSALSCSS